MSFYFRQWLKIASMSAVLAVWLMFASLAGAAPTTARVQTASPTQRTQTDSTVGLANGSVSIAFDRKTGALKSLKNLATNDEYLKGPETDGNPFRLYLDTKDTMPPAARAGDPYRTTPLEDAMGGQIVDASACRLTSSSFDRTEHGGVLKLVVQHPRSKLEMALTVALPDEDVSSDWTLQVANGGGTRHRVMVAFPYLTGLAIGPDRSANRGVKLRQWGMSNLPAWAQTGWPYPIWNMQWNAAYDPATDQGLGMIVADDKARPGKIFRRFAPSGMSVLHYPAAELSARQSVKLPTAQILVHRHDWRFVAERYRRFITKSFPQHQAPEWLRLISVLGSCPNFGPIGRGEDAGKPVPTFADTSSSFFSWAYEGGGLGGWQELLKGGAFPGYTGDYIVRADMGGAASLKQAVDKAHAGGQRVLLTIAFHTMHRDALFLKGRNPRDFWVQPSPDADFDKTVTNKNFFACMGYKPWQDQFISVCTRLLAETGVDGFYLDEGGNAYWPCFNPAHKHTDPYNLNETFWGVTMHKRLREAMDKVNPHAILTAESANEANMPYLDGVHCGETPDRYGIPFGIVYPRLRKNCYAPTVPAMLNDMNAGDGALAMSDQRPMPDAVAYHEQIQGKGGVAPATLGFEEKDPEQVKKLTPSNLRWAELRTSFSETLDQGDQALPDPVAVAVENPSEYVARLWRGPRYWLLTAGHFAAWPLDKPMRFKLPELDEQIHAAYEIDLTTLDARPTQLSRGADGIYVTIHHGFSAVLLPKPQCPPLIITDPEMPTLKAEGTYQIGLRALAPWHAEPRDVVIKVVAAGLEVQPAQPSLPGVVQLKVPPGLGVGCYFLRITGDCLPVKRNLWRR